MACLSYLILTTTLRSRDYTNFYRWWQVRESLIRTLAVACLWNNESKCNSLSSVEFCLCWGNISLGLWLGFRSLDEPPFLLSLQEKQGWTWWNVVSCCFTDTAQSLFDTGQSRTLVLELMWAVSGVFLTLVVWGSLWTEKRPLPLRHSCFSSQLSMNWPADKKNFHVHGSCGNPHKQLLPPGNKTYQKKKKIKMMIGRYGQWFGVQWRGTLRYFHSMFYILHSVSECLLYAKFS